MPVRPPERPNLRSHPRLAGAFVRARRAKVVVTVGGVGLFGVALVLARASYASHPKHPPSALTPPKSFVDTIRNDQLQAGIVAPPTAPPEVQSATS